MQQIFDGFFITLLLAEVIYVWVYCRKRKKDEQKLRQQEIFLGEVAVQYMKAADLKEAIRDSVRPLEPAVEGKAEELLDSLEKGTMENVPDNSYFAVFCAMCHTVADLGDIRQEGQSLFVKNIQYIEEEIRMEILRQQNAAYRFSGLMGLCVLPFFMIPFIQGWALSVESGMGDFYNGSYGFSTTWICWLFAALGLFVVLWLHYPDYRTRYRGCRIEERLLQLSFLRHWLDQRISRHYSIYLKKNEVLKRFQGFGNIRQFLLRKYLYLLAGAVLVFAGICLVHQAGRIELYHRVSLPTAWQVELNQEKQRDQLEDQLTKAFQQMVEEGRQKASLKPEDLCGCSRQVFTGCMQLLESQKQAYDRIRLHWYHLFLILAGGLAAYLLPDLKLSIFRWNVEQRKMEETLRFQTMLLILCRYPQMTVEEVLQWLERFADLFRQAFERAVDSFSYDRKKALQQLREDVGYEPVARIADNLWGCDEVRIADAFSNMEAERDYYMDQYKQKLQAWTGQRAALAKLIAYLPFLLILALKLIVPFVLQGLSQMQMYSDSLTHLT